MDNKTENFDFFKEQVEHYYEFFKLHRWKLEIKLSEEDSDSHAYIEYDDLETGQYCATLTANLYWLMDENDLDKIRLVAFHEILELLLAELVRVAESRYISELMIPNSIHSIVRTLENTIYELIPKKL
jgi:hypothetical protein